MLPPIRPTYLMCSQYAWTTCSRKFTSFFILPTDPRFTIELVTFSTFVPWASFRWCINQMLWLVFWWRVISGQMRISSGIGNCTFTPGMFIHILWLCPSKPPAAAAKETNYHICCEARTSSRSCDNSWLSTLVPATFCTNVQTFSTSNIQKTSIWSNSPTSILSHLSKSFEIHFYSNNGIGNFRSSGWIRF